MSDPAIEAAQRAWSRPRGGAWTLKHFDLHNRLVQCHIAAAREALRPIRKLHQSYWTEECGFVCQACGSEGMGQDSWPCATAKLIYTTDELKTGVAQ